MKRIANAIGVGQQRMFRLLVVVVHFIVVEGADIRPLCGNWAGSPNWSRIRGAVSCPRCRKLLERPAA